MRHFGSGYLSREKSGGSVYGDSLSTQVAVTLTHVHSE